ncbi:regulatory protein RecX [Lacihabitans sp. LS3-19]|uniref:regulatory protein RecX n=1 Tax=Lacihabitans sp. LS3-19 TaxID=2487335 RepID=UPI0020CBB4FE|nr:regulatory protein RecX [Lacihabitans sp. LS3-19]
MDTAILKKAANYCVYQERTQDEVRKRLREWKVYGDEAEEIIAWLIVENYLNEERFAKAFAGGKFRIKKWGKNRILAELKVRKISKYNLDQAIKEISFDDYILTLENLIIKKTEDVKTEPNYLKRKQKIFNYLISKGFESNLILETIKKLESKTN